MLSVFEKKGVSQSHKFISLAFLFSDVKETDRTRRNDCLLVTWHRATCLPTAAEFHELNMLNFEWDSLKNFQFGSNKFRRPYAGPKWRRAVSKVFDEFTILNVFSYRGYVIGDISGSAVARASLESWTEDYWSLITLHRELYWYLTPIRNRTLIFSVKFLLFDSSSRKVVEPAFIF